MRLNWVACLPLALVLAAAALVTIQGIYLSRPWLSLFIALLACLFGCYEWRQLNKRYQGKLIFWPSLSAHPDSDKNKIGWYWQQEKPNRADIPLTLLSARLTHQQFVVLNFRRRAPWKHLFPQCLSFCVLLRDVESRSYRQLRRLVATGQAFGEV